jgi:hypothetical protein
MFCCNPSPAPSQEPPVQTPTSPDFTSSERTQDGASQSTSRATEIGRRAAAALDEKRDTVASGLEAAAASLAAQVDSLPGGERVARAAQTTADALEEAADYVRDQDVEAMLSDVGQIVKRHPGAAMLTALALGFVLARSFSRH